MRSLLKTPEGVSSQINQKKKQIGNNLSYSKKKISTNKDKTTEIKQDKATINKVEDKRERMEYRRCKK